MAYDGKEFRGPNGVNVAEILRVADAVERSATFDMRTYVHDECGSAACIVGHAITQRQRQNFITGMLDDPTISARKKLGLRMTLAQQLFYPRKMGAHYQPTGCSEDHITNAHAAACLRKLAATGEVDWIGTKPEAAK